MPFLVHPVCLDRDRGSCIGCNDRDYAEDDGYESNLNPRDAVTRLYSRTAPG